MPFALKAFASKNPGRVPIVKSVFSSVPDKSVQSVFRWNSKYWTRLCEDSPAKQRTKIRKTRIFKKSIVR